jgi:sugar lactone lactonase YvrE
MESKMEEWKVTEPWLDAHCALGEGPYYEKSTNSLRFVDIKKKQVHCVLLAEGPSSLKTTQLDVPVTVTADIEGQDPQAKILLGLKYGIGVLDRESGKYEYVTKFSEESDNDRLRSNDGAADPHGRFWLGTMTDFGLGDFQPEGETASSAVPPLLNAPTNLPLSFAFPPQSGKREYALTAEARQARFSGSTGGQDWRLCAPA